MLILIGFATVIGVGATTLLDRHVLGRGASRGAGSATPGVMRVAGRPVYVVTALRKKGHWNLAADVDGVMVRLRAKRQAREAARKAISRALADPDGAFETDLEIHIPADMRQQIDESRQAMREASTARARAATRGHAAAVPAEGPGRDIGVLLGVSPRTVSDLLARYRIVDEIELAKDADPSTGRADLRR